MYSGVDSGQWDPDALALLRSEGRPAHQFNVIQGAVDTAAGILHQNPFNTLYRAQDAEASNRVNLAQRLFEYERDRGHWQREEMKFIRAGLVYRGCAKYAIDYSSSQLGNVQWEDVAPWNVTPDPSWASDNVKYLRFAYHDEFYDPDFIADHWKDKSEYLAMAVRQMQDESFMRGVQERLEGHWNECFHNGKYRVLELHFMTEEEIAEVWNLTTQEKVKNLPKPAMEILLKDEPKKYRKIVKIEKKSKVVVWVPALGNNGILLAEGDYALQLGRIPFDFFSAKNIYGQVQGLVDPLVDPQEVLNKRESSVTYWESQTTNASQIADSTFFPDANSRRKLEREGNKPGQIHWADGAGRDLRAAIINMPMGNPPTHLTVGAERMQTLIERMSHLDTAIGAGKYADATGQSGKHFAEMLAASLVPFEPLNQALQSVWGDRAESFIPAAKYVFAYVTRKIKSPSQPESLVVNMPTISGDVDNDIESLSRYEYTIEASELGENKRARESGSIARQIQMTSNPLMRTALEIQGVDYQDFDEAAKNQMKQLGMEFLNFQKVQIQSQVAQMSMQIQQMQAQTQQAQAGIPQDGQPPSPTGPKEAARAPGQGPIPEGAGVAGQQTATNNSQTPSDFR